MKKQLAGSYLINEPRLAQEIIRATKEGAGGLPVSVKTRVGFNRVELESWLSAILECEPGTCTVDGG
jgi:tRNA-dihydrouridine synthase